MVQTEKTTQLRDEASVETHPFEPFLPANARLLMLGTFPPAPKRWCMDWYYPNYTNDMWRIVGIAIYDTCNRIRRTTGTASDKDLEVVERADLDGLLRALPHSQGVVTAGQLATQLFASHYGIDIRKMQMGEHRDFLFDGRTVSLYRQPSSSRAYPMQLERKAAYYKNLFDDLGL